MATFWVNLPAWGCANGRPHAALLSAMSTPAKEVLIHSTPIQVICNACSNYTLVNSADFLGYRRCCSRVAIDEDFIVRSDAALHVMAVTSDARTHFSGLTR